MLPMKPKLEIHTFQLLFLLNLWNKKTDFVFFSFSGFFFILIYGSQNTDKFKI